MMAAPFEDGEGPVEIAVGIGEGVVQRIAYPGLGAKMDHPIELLPNEQGRDGLPVREIAALEAKTGQLQELRQPRLFQAHLVVVIEIVEADDLMPFVTEPLRHMKADKAGSAGDQVLHCAFSSACAFSRLSPRPMA